MARKASFQAQAQVPSQALTPAHVYCLLSPSDCLSDPVKQCCIQAASAPLLAHTAPPTKIPSTQLNNWPTVNTKTHWASLPQEAVLELACSASHSTQKHSSHNVFMLSTNIYWAASICKTPLSTVVTKQNACPLRAYILVNKTSNKQTEHNVREVHGIKQSGLGMPVPGRPLSGCGIRSEASRGQSKPCK